LATKAGSVVQSIPYLVIMIATVLAVAAILVLPRRRYRAINFTLDIDASRDRVWSLLVEAIGPGSWRPEVVAIRPHTGEPDLINHVCFYNGERFTIVQRILDRIEGQSLVMRCEEIAGSFLPLGSRAFAAIKLDNSANGTRLSYREEGAFNSLLTYLMFRAAQRAAFGRLQRQAEAGARAAEREAGWLVPSAALIAGSAIAAGLITTIAGWQIGLLVFAFLSIMEYGHAFVLRSQGSRPSFALLLPFVGGAMIMTRQKSSALGEAVRALSGPAALSLVVVALSAAAAFMDTGDLAENTQVAAAVAAGIVLVFLLPFYPMNGGWLFNALQTSLPAASFRYPALAASGFVLVWSTMNGAVLAAALSAALVYEIFVPRRAAPALDTTLSPRTALILTAAYCGMMIIAHSALTAI
jgi:hypothetical protein